MVQICGRIVADVKEIEPENHIIPLCSQAFDDIMELVKFIECTFVGVGCLEGCILLEINF